MIYQSLSLICSCPTQNKDLIMEYELSHFKYCSCPILVPSPGLYYFQGTPTAGHVIFPLLLFRFLHNYVHLQCIVCLTHSHSHSPKTHNMCEHSYIHILACTQNVMVILSFFPTYAYSCWYTQIVLLLSNSTCETVEVCD